MANNGALLRGLAGLLVLASLWSCSGRPQPAPSLPARTPQPVTGWSLLPEIVPARPAGLDGTDAAAWDRARHALTTDRLDAAHRTAFELAEARPTLAAPRILLGWVALRSGETGAAVDHFERALSMSPSSDLQSRNAARAGVVLAALDAGRRIEAFEGIEEIRKSAPDHVVVSSYFDELRLELADEWLRRGRELRAMDPRSAAEAYETSLRYAPEAVDLHLELARLHVELGALDGALARVADAVALHPTYVPALELHAELLERSGDVEAALAAYHRLAREAPFDPTWSNRAEHLAREARRLRPPPELNRIRRNETVTREELSAVLAGTLGSVLESAPRTPVIVTDVEDSWAREYILSSLALGLQDAYPGHTFEPRTPVSTRALADSLLRAARWIDGRCVRTVASSCGEEAARRGTARGLVDELLAGAPRPTGALAVEAASRLAELAKSCLD